MKIRWLFLLALFSGCVSKRTEMLPVNYQYVDSPDKGAIELTWTNIYPYEVCFLREMWPDKNGLVVSAFDSVSIVVDDNRYVMELVDGDYCPECITRVASGEEIKAAIPYHWFGLPQNLFDESKQLHFAPKTFKCKGNL